MIFEHHSTCQAWHIKKEIDPTRHHNATTTQSGLGVTLHDPWMIFENHFTCQACQHGNIAGGACMTLNNAHAEQCPRTCVIVTCNGPQAWHLHRVPQRDDEHQPDWPQLQPGMQQTAWSCLHVVLSSYAHAFRQGAIAGATPHCSPHICAGGARRI